MCAVATVPNTIPVSFGWGSKLLNTEDRANTRDEHAQRAKPPWKMRWESRPAPIRREEASCEKRDGSRKPTEVTREGYKPEEAKIEPQWWRKTSAKEAYNKGGALFYVRATAVLRVDVAGSPCDALLDTGTSRSFISPKTIEQLKVKVRRLKVEHRFRVVTGEQFFIDHVLAGLTMWCGHANYSGDFLVGPVPYDLVLGLVWLNGHKVAWYFQSDKLRTYVNGK
ncbi:hypothetical protein, conserved [Eimeria necatrix]|uniref:Uncharacterized protein n=1 Tax=Eimeria necatrix TaxID=51315 RepID=U6N1K2_9EIME|nr:hypothetical protein, conserved [Eimeria necatrix]CDJ70368.1 hypothetical protein, conserved [Eimeria necatrix]